MMNQVEKDAQFLLIDLKNNRGRQSTWDYDADYRFALYCGDNGAINALEQIYNSYSVGPLLIAIHDIACKSIKRRRLAALRYLKKQGYLVSLFSGFWLYGDLIRTNEYFLLSHPDTPDWIREL